MELTSNQREALKLGWRLADLAEEQARTVTSYEGSEMRLSDKLHIGKAPRIWTPQSDASAIQYTMPPNPKNGKDFLGFLSFGGEPAAAKWPVGRHLRLKGIGRRTVIIP